jgi:hypothetical protein
MIHGPRDEGYPKFTGDGRIALDWHTTVRAVAKGKLKITNHTRAIYGEGGLRGFVHVPWWETRGDE